MGKLVLESALFVCILWQVYILATGANGYSAPSLKDNDPAVEMTAGSSYLQSYNTQNAVPAVARLPAPSKSQNSLNPYKIGPYAENIGNMEAMARQEAQRILATGDYQSLQKRIEDNSFLLRLSGH